MVLFLLAIPLVFAPTAALAVIGLGIAVVVPVGSHLLRSGLAEAEGVNRSFGYLLADPLGQLGELAVTGSYPAQPWMAYLCAGLVIGRLPLPTARVAAGLLAGGVVLAVTASALSWLALGPLGGRAQIQPRSTGRKTRLGRQPRTRHTIRAGAVDRQGPAGNLWTRSPVCRLSSEQVTGFDFLSPK